MICPSCGQDNIEGSDACENCMEPLSDLDVPRADATRGLVRLVMEDDLSRLEQQPALTARSEETVAEVVRRMKGAGAGCVLVIDDGELAGIFTERDALRKIGSSGPENYQAATAAQISELMKRKPETLHETDSVAAALNKMSIGGFRHVPVVRSNGNYTVVSIEQLLNYIASKDW